MKIKKVRVSKTKIVLLPKNDTNIIAFVNFDPISVTFETPIGTLDLWNLDQYWKHFRDLVEALDHTYANNIGTNKRKLTDGYLKKMFDIIQITGNMECEYAILIPTNNNLLVGRYIFQDNHISIGTLGVAGGMIAISSKKSWFTIYNLTQQIDVLIEKHEHNSNQTAIHI